ncbi:MAG TPA: enoyl-CoA hydratase-related protein [Acidimicrobiales bacterium]|nr:enoyl-CoA hydratase-related protein [Acidimicrobiales bacterium]
MGALVQRERRGPVEVVALNDPDRMNALSLDLLHQLDAAMVDIAGDDRIGAVVVTGAGGKAFSAGADLASLIPVVTEQGLAALFPDPSERFFSRVEKPIVAAVEGFCLAGGFEVMLGTDLRVAGESATFGLPEVRWGLVPVGGSHVRVPLQVPWAVAMQLLLTGRPIPAQRAYEVGLVNEVVPDGTALERAVELAEQITANGPLAVRMAKRIAVETLGLDAAFRTEAAMGDPVFKSADAQEGPRAFVERRRPQFTGR